MNKNLLNLLLITLSLCSIALLAACDKKTDEADPKTQHVITNLTITLEPEQGGQKVVARYRDLDGPEGVPPTIDPIVLKESTRYTARIRLFDEKNLPSTDLTDTYIKAGDVHEFFFTAHNAAMSFTKEDSDINSNPIGFLTLVETGDTGTGFMRIRLKHLPTQKGPNSIDAAGEEVFNAAFPVTIE